MVDNPTSFKNSKNITDNEFLQGFGYKISWYVFSETELKRSHLTIEELANQLGMQQQNYLSWNQGLDWLAEQYFQPSWYFITPSLKGFHYIVCGVADTLDLLDNVMDNYVAFTSYRVVGAVAWKIVKNDKIERYFTYADGQVLHNEGQQTLAEKQLNLCDLSGLDLDSATEKIYAHMEQFEEQSDLTALDDEDNPARLCEILTGQNPLKYDGMPTVLVKEKGIIGYIA